MKKVLVIAAAAILATAGTSFAFHGGGVAHCDGCHSMHAGNGNGRFLSQGPSLTNAADPSSVCLNCHNGAARYHVNSDDGSNTNEGGDFHWTRQDNSYTYYNRGVRSVDPNQKGHNILAADFGLNNDANLTAAPGGSYLSAGFACTSCHDPHGQVNGGTKNGMAPISVSGSYGEVPDAGTIAGNYRLLWDSSKVGFSEDAPIARANSYDGASVQYGAGMSGWCANCHLGFYTQNTNAGMHPTDVAPPATYNSYIATGNFNGQQASAYDPLVPIERGGVTASSELPDPTDPLTAGVGTNGTTAVMCLTCHRAHASAFDNALRFDYTTSEFIAESWFTQGQDGVIDDPDGIPESGDEVIGDITNRPADTAAPYYKHGEKVDVANDPVAAWDGGYGHYQRSLCNKCHVKD